MVVVCVCVCWGEAGESGCMKCGSHEGEASGVKCWRQIYENNKK